MFDRAQIWVKAGDGGDGVVAFHREKFIPYGGPDGGDGGRGGDVVIRASDAEDSLRKYRQKRLHRAENGRAGSGNKKHGKDGDKLVLTVPPGTLVSALEGDEKVLIADLEKPGDEAVVARGGKGGWGNTHFTSSTNQAPKIAQKGEPGEEKPVVLDMRLIADVGIIGYPNAGKSTLLAAASAARPKVADYPFTTLEPVLGVVEVGRECFIMAEIPGLIAGAHLGRGLGHDFLRHALRTKILIHLLNGTAASPIDDMLKVNEELALFEMTLARKRQLVVINKNDLPEVQERLAVIKTELAGAGIKAYDISAATGQGVNALMKEAWKVLKEESAGEKAIDAEPPVKVFRPQPREERVKVNKVGEEFIVSAPSLERIKGGAGVRPDDLRWQLNYQFKRLGIDKALEKAGVKAGDKVRCGELTWEWTPPGRKK
jgi:GTP-binding protein